MDPGADRRCTFDSRDVVTFTASAGSSNVLVQPFTNDMMARAPLGNFSGEAVRDGCSTLTVLDVTSQDQLTIRAFSGGSEVGSTISWAFPAPESGLQGRRSTGSPFRLDGAP